MITGIPGCTRRGFPPAAGWPELGGKRAVLLARLPPSQPRDDTRLACFLRLVPGWTPVAVEFRHPSWHCEQIFALLEEHRPRIAC